MRSLSLKQAIIAVLVLALIGGLSVFAVSHYGGAPAPTVAQPIENVSPIHRVLGTSLQGRAIDSYTYGTGDTHLAFVGGMHGGYEWNSVLLASIYGLSCRKPAGHS